MKTVLILLLILPCCTFAQDSRLGVKVGVNFATINGKGTEDVSGITQFHAGLFTKEPLAKNLKIQPEVLFSVYGFKSSDGDNFTAKLNYIAIPIIFKYYVAENFSIDAGPQGGILILAQTTNRDDNVSIRSFNNRDFGANLGLSVNFVENVALSSRYYFGFSNVANENLKNKNRVLQFALEITL